MPRTITTATTQAPFPTPALDHLVVAARSLDEGVAVLQERLGVPLEPGGTHRTMGTHNALLLLDNGIYLEVIARHPRPPEPPRPRWFGLDLPAVRARLDKGPCLLHWVVRTPHIDRWAERFSALSGPVIPMSRGRFTWRISVPEDGSLPGDGLFPSCIRWQTEHPSAQLPDRSCRLLALEAVLPEQDRGVGAALAAAGLDRLLLRARGSPPALRARVVTPTGIHLIE